MSYGPSGTSLRIGREVQSRHDLDVRERLVQVVRSLGSKPVHRLSWRASRLGGHASRQFRTSNWCEYFRISAQSIGPSPFKCSVSL